MCNQPFYSTLLCFEVLNSIIHYQLHTLPYRFDENLKHFHSHIISDLIFVYISLEYITRSVLMHLNHLSFISPM